MNLIATSISDLRNNLSDYLALVAEGKTMISVRNAKGGKEVARIVLPTPLVSENDEIEKRIKKLKKLAGFAAGYPNKNRKLLRKIDLEYVRKMKKGITE